MQPRRLFGRVVSVIGVVLSFVLTGHAAERGSYVYVDAEPGDGPVRKMRVHVPVVKGPLRGILLVGNGAGGDATGEADFPRLQRWASHHRFCVVATGYFKRFQGGFEGDDWRVLNAGLMAVAEARGCPEIPRLPMLCWGFSNGGQMAYGLARLLPERTLAFVVNKGGFYETGIGRDPLDVPGLFIAGELDRGSNDRRAVIEQLYRSGRELGAPWAWVEECNAGHVPGNSEALAFVFFEAVLAARHPVSAGDDSGDILPVNKSRGWLVAQGREAWASGFLPTRSAAGGDDTRCGWVPDESTARALRAMASWDSEVSADFGDNRRKAVCVMRVAEVADGIDYVAGISPRHRSWERLEIYDGDTLLETVGHADPAVAERDGVEQVSVRLRPDKGRNLNVLYCELVLSDGSRRTSRVDWRAP